MAGGTSFVLHMKGDTGEGVASRVVSCEGGGCWFSPMKHVAGQSVLRFHCQTPKHP